MRPAVTPYRVVDNPAADAPVRHPSTPRCSSTRVDHGSPRAEHVDPRRAASRPRDDHDGAVESRAGWRFPDRRIRRVAADSPARAAAAGRRWRDGRGTGARQGLISANVNKRAPVHLGQGPCPFRARILRTLDASGRPGRAQRSTADASGPSAALTRPARTGAARRRSPRPSKEVEPLPRHRHESATSASRSASAVARRQERGSDPLAAGRPHGAWHTRGRR